MINNPSKKRISDRHKRLANLYFECNFNKDEATRRAGYAHANKVSPRLFGREDVKEEIEKIRKRMEEKFELTNEWIIKQLMVIAYSGVSLAKFMKKTPDGKLDWDFTDATPEELAAINSIQTEVEMEGKAGGKIKKFKLTTVDRLKALEMLARIQGMFQDKTEANVTVNLWDRLDEGRQQARKEEEVDGDSSGPSANPGD